MPYVHQFPTRQVLQHSIGRGLTDQQEAIDEV